MKRILFVDDDQAELLILERMLRSLQNEWEMAFVQSGREALVAMENSPFDAIVTDMQMPGMDGAELLEQVRREYPQVIRIVLSGAVDEDDAFRAVGPTHVWLPKPCNIEFLRSIIERAYTWREFLTDPDLARLIGGMKSLPSVPRLYVGLVEELRSPDTSFRDVADIISNDVGMAAKILKMVNSAFFGLNRRVSSLEQAISILGLKMIKALVLSVKVFTQFDQTKVSAFSIEELMNHSVATGSLARLIVRDETRSQNLADDAFMSGLMHDVGKLVLADNEPEGYDRMLARARQKELPSWMIELEEFGSTHADVGAYLLALWGLPDPIVTAAAYHHRPSDCAEKEFSSLTAVHVANILQQQEYPLPGAGAQAAVEVKYLASLGLEDRLAKWSDLCGVLAHY